MQAEIVHAHSCHLQETRVIDFGRDLWKIYLHDPLRMDMPVNV